MSYRVRTILCFTLIIGGLARCGPPAGPPPEALELTRVPEPLADEPALTGGLATELRVPPPDTLPPIDYDTSQWTELIRLDTTIRLDIRYATANNFVGEQMYDCGRCLLRPPVARAIAAAHRELGERGLGLKMYDCYRPRPYQQRLWDKVPDARYVARPSRGSVHNRGAAVDLTLYDRRTGRELPMGTDYDYFGPEGHAAYAELPDSILANRRLLQTTLRRHGFATIRTEWWHFDFRGPRYPLSDELWTCPANGMVGTE